MGQAWKKKTHMDPTSTARGWDSVKHTPGEDGQLVAWRRFHGCKELTLHDECIWRGSSSHQSGGRCLELPAGVVADNGSPEAAALQEPEEEMGCEGDLAEWLDPGLSHCTYHMWRQQLLTEMRLKT